MAAEAAHWVLEIDASRLGKVRYGIAPTKRHERENPQVEPQVWTYDEPEKGARPRFQARLLMREGALQAQPKIRSRLRRVSGIRVLLEGFRVLPYGEPGNDWLRINEDYTRRSRELDSISAAMLADREADKDAALIAPPSQNYHGAVFLTQEGAETLQMLVNREGFSPTPEFDSMVDLVRGGIDLLTRTRAAATVQARHDRRERRRRRVPSGGEEVPPPSQRRRKPATRLSSARRTCPGQCNS